MATVRHTVTMPSPFHRLPGDIPVLWTSPDSIQLGVDPPRVTLEWVPEGAESLLYALQCGTSESGLRMLARSKGIGSDWVETLIEAVSDLGQKPTAPVTQPWTVWTDSEAGSALEILAGYSDFPLQRATEVSDDTMADCTGILVVADYLIHPHWLGQLARHDCPHLPIVFSDQAVTVGPLIQPGVTPCLTCLESTRRDSTPHWLEVSSQLWGKQSPLHSPHTHGVAWAMVMALILEATPHAVTTPFPRASYRPDSDQIVWSAAEFHPDCTCLGLNGP